MTLILALLLAAAAQVPTDLDGLVAVALTRDPSAAALSFDAAAARSRGRGAIVPMDPQLMVGVDALGAGMDAPDPTMAMVGVTQMLRGPGEGRALARRADLEATRSEVDRERLAADLRTRLWQTAARIGTLQSEAELIEEQVRSAVALRELAFARYASGAAIDGGMGGMAQMGPMAPMDGAPMGAAPPLVVPRGGGPAMGGMAGMAMGGGGRGQVLVETDDMAQMGGAPTSEAPMPPTSGIAIVLDLDARIARVEADRAALRADLDGELAVLGILVGDEAAAAVAAQPDAYLGLAGGPAPELELARLDQAAAAQDLRIARISRRPDLMLSAAQRFMPDGMPMGTDVGVGVEVPLWGGRGRSIEAAQAELEAAGSRLASVERDLDLAAAQSRAALAAARARAAALEDVALPRAKAAWDASLALFASGSAGQADVVRAWENWIAVGRAALAARRDVELRAAQLARVEAT